MAVVEVRAVAMRVLFRCACGRRCARRIRRVEIGFGGTYATLADGRSDPPRAPPTEPKLGVMRMVELGTLVPHPSRTNDYENLRAALVASAPVRRCHRVIEEPSTMDQREALLVEPQHSHARMKESRSRRISSPRHRDTVGNAGITDHQARFVVNQTTFEPVGGRYVVVVLSRVFTRYAPIVLLQAVHGGIRRSDICGRRGGLCTECEAHPSHRQPVGHRRAFQVHIEATGQARRGLAVDTPVAHAICLDPDRPCTEGRAGGDPSASGRPSGVHPDRVVDRPRLAVLDGRRASPQPAAMIVAFEEDDLETSAGVAMLPGRGGRRGGEHDAHNRTPPGRPPPDRERISGGYRAWLPNHRPPRSWSRAARVAIRPDRQVMKPRGVTRRARSLVGPARDSGHRARSVLTTVGG